jgi:hypothetical protein
MQLSSLLEQKRKAILKRWYSFIIELYPPDVSSFLISEKDRFANPVGHTILTGIEILFDEVCHGTNHDRIISALDSIIRIRAVQDFTPSEALAFVGMLKDAVQEELNDSGFDLQSSSELREGFLQLQEKIDDLSSLAAEIYKKCRDDINRIKTREARSRKFIENRLIRAMNSERET